MFPLHIKFRDFCHNSLRRHVCDAQEGNLSVTKTLILCMRLAVEKKIQIIIYTSMKFQQIAITLCRAHNYKNRAKKQFVPMIHYIHQMGGTDFFRRSISTMLFSKRPTRSDVMAPPRLPWWECYIPSCASTWFNTFLITLKPLSQLTYIPDVAL